MLKVFPENLAASDTLLYGWLCTLPCAYNDTVSQKINGDWCLKLSYPSARPEADYLINDNLILAEGQLYRIRRVKKVDEGGRQAVEIEAPHIAFDLQNFCIENIETDADDSTLDGINAQTALTQLLAGTPFSVGTVDVDLTHMDYLDILQKNVMSCLKDQLVKKWGGELVFDNWTVHLRQQAGQARQYPIRQGKNIVGLKYTEDLSETVTRLHIIGYGGADVKPVNNDLDYIDSTYISNYSHVMEGYVTFDDEDDPAALLALGQQHLATVEVPKISFDISLARLKSSPQYRFYAALETFELGDTALLHHNMLGADVALRCQERTFNASTGVNASVKLGNVNEVIASTLAAAKAAAEALSKVMTSTGTVRANKLEGVIDALKTSLYASAEYQTATVKDNQGILFVNNQVGSPSYGAMYLGPGLLAIANTKDANGAWAWRSFGNGSGFSADEITAGTLSAARIDVNSLDLSGNEALQTVLETLQGAISLRVSQSTYDEGIGALEAGAQATNQRIGALEVKQNSVTLSVERIESAVDDVTGEQNKLSTYLRVTDSGMEVGKQGSPFNTFQDDNHYAIKENGTEVASWSNNKMTVDNAEIRYELQIGNYAFTKTSDGGIGLVWKG